MIAIEIISELNARGVHLWAEADRLKFEAPAGILTEDDRQAIREHKAELLALLRSEPGAEVCPICHGALQEQRGKRFTHVWCPTGGHFDAWRTLDGGKLKDSGAPIFGEIAR